MSEPKIVTLNLLSGEFILGELIGKPDTTVTIKNPIVSIVNHATGVMYFTRYNQYVNQHDAVIFNRDSVVIVTEVSDLAKEYYVKAMKYIHTVVDGSFEEMMKNCISRIDEYLVSVSESSNQDSTNDSTNTVSVDEFFKHMNKPKDDKLN